MLKSWPVIPLESALELLYCTYTDLTVRKFAVKCLESRLTDDNLMLYMLQLVQVRYASFNVVAFYLLINLFVLDFVSVGTRITYKVTKSRSFFGFYCRLKVVLLCICEEEV